MTKEGSKMEGARVGGISLVFCTGEVGILITKLKRWTVVLRILTRSFQKKKKNLNQQIYGTYLPTKIVLVCSLHIQNR